jgi:hypothetical protein
MNLFQSSEHVCQRMITRRRPLTMPLRTNITSISYAKCLPAVQKDRLLVAWMVHAGLGEDHTDDRL